MTSNLLLGTNTWLLDVILLLVWKQFCQNGFFVPQQSSAAVNSPIFFLKKLLAVYRNDNFTIIYSRSTFRKMWLQELRSRVTARVTLVWHYKVSHMFNFHWLWQSKIYNHSISQCNEDVYVSQLGFGSAGFKLKSLCSSLFARVRSLRLCHLGCSFERCLWVVKFWSLNLLTMSECYNKIFWIFKNQS